MKWLARWWILLAIVTVTLALTAALVATAAPPDTSPLQMTARHDPVALLEPELAKALATARPDERLNVIVEMREPAAPVARAALVAAGSEEPAAARRQMVSALQIHAEQTQAALRVELAARWLAGDVTQVTPFWIINGLAVNGARAEVVHELAARPDVALIRLDHWRQWIDDARRAIPLAQPQWGVAQVRADMVWTALQVDGAGVVVANLDTGVDWQHPALQASYRGYSPKGFYQHAGNWFDATGQGALYPVDGNGHGTHTMGTMVGQDGIGVAPGAQWIAVRTFSSSGYALDSWIHAGFEWILAPDGDPDLAPHVVNNSWSSKLGTVTTFQEDLQTLRAAGILAVFSAGNNGPNRGTVGAPGSLPGAFAVGASDPDDEVVIFSSRGPSPWGEIRPQVVAPGVQVYSTLPGGTYGFNEGTSMAAPHVAGVAALMLSAQPDLTITQTTYILTRTAVPLTTSTPNNDSGYGRADAYTAVALAANAGLISGTVKSGDAPLPDAAIRATPSISGLGSTTSSDQAGRYQLFLGANYYDVTANAFGYAPVSLHALPVITGEATVQDFDLQPLPTGQVRGKITTEDGDPVEATVSVLHTPVTTMSAGGNYSLSLPEGNYTLRVRALGYRVVTANVTIQANQNAIRDFVLPASMRILLVDNGAWYYQSQISYYRQALDDSLYAYDERRVKHFADDSPTVTDLLPYELVIWSSPQDGPAMLGQGGVITDYLGTGGNLLISGQDVGFWDGGGNLRFHSYYINYLHSIFQADNAPSRQVVCLDDSAFGNLTLTIEGPGGADNQRWPDEIQVYHPDHASLACSYKDGGGAVIEAGFCDAHRALNLGFGLEAVNSAADRANFMSRAVDWFGSPRQTVGLALQRHGSGVQVALPGDTAIHSLSLRNLGEIGAGDLFQIEYSGNEWPTSLASTTVQLTPCATALIDLHVEIPSDAAPNALDTLTLTARSTISPALSQSLVLTSKVPAPVLLVDDDRWYNQEQVYEQALKASGLPYDRWEVGQQRLFGSGSPSTEVLGWYPVVLWFNGYDWFDPIHPSEVERLTSYLDGGGRLFLSSQEYLYRTEEEDALRRDYFGVIAYSEALSQTAVWGAPGHVLGNGLTAIELAYPFRNWSDSVLPAPGSRVAFWGQHGQPGALTREGACSDGPSGCRWRTALFVFPFEALPQEARLTLMPRLVGWLSWLGRSDLQADRLVASAGDVAGYTLTLRNDGPEAALDVRLSNPLPPGTALASGPTGGAQHDAPGRRITWNGDLASGAALTFTYRLSLTTGTATLYDGVRNTAHITLGEQGLHFEKEAYVRFAAPDLSSSRMTLQETGQTSATVGSLNHLSVTLVLRNAGLADAPNIHVDNPLPWPMALVSGTLSSGGVGSTTELLEAGRVQWDGPVAVGTPVTLTYRAVAPRLFKNTTWAYDAARIKVGPENGTGQAWERGIWLYVRPNPLYLPLVIK